MRGALLLFATVAALAACGATDQDWALEVPQDQHRPTTIDAKPIPKSDTDDAATLSAIASANEPPSTDAAVSLELAAPDVYRNTYYDFPVEGGGDQGATIFDATCAPISKVTKDFHDKVCVQGSGKLRSGATVSFAKRDCSCAAECPRTGQRICFERLDPKLFPNGRGATGKAITPLVTLAVDTQVIPLGTKVFIPEFVGLPTPGGKKHDGCFVAEDRGIKVVGKQVDVFTGDPAVTADWNARVPSNQGVKVFIGDPRCR